MCQTGNFKTCRIYFQLINNLYKRCFLFYRGHRNLTFLTQRQPNDKNCFHLSVYRPKNGHRRPAEKDPDCYAGNYIENFLQSIFNTIPNLSEKSFLVGGDGRYLNKAAIQKIIKIAAANNVKKLYVGQNGLVSTPAGSHIILKNKLDGGLILTASHNPGGIDGDFGIKYATATGGQCQPAESQTIQEQTLSIREYRISDCPDIDLSTVRTARCENTEVEIIDPFADYIE